MQDRGDDELLVAIATGPGALPEFYRRHVAKVMGMGVRRFADPEDVADFVATVFLEVLRSAAGFDPRRGGAVSWLYGLAANVAASMYRKRALTAKAEQRLAGRSLLDADDYARVEERIDAAAQLRRVYQAMQQLGEADRRLLELVAVDGMSLTDAAHALRITPVAARVRLLRARRRLRSALTPVDETFPVLSHRR
ncbi:MAG TPA: sigma-70 family RNA polymerase sigma factor [Micromonosporaceae bacterium]|nr:sigma-70 family RNA polymerase sigma factor [Micromonosporaceae bacterium]